MQRLDAKRAFCLDIFRVGMLLEDGIAVEAHLLARAADALERSGEHAVVHHAATPDHAATRIVLATSATQPSWSRRARHLIVWTVEAASARDTNACQSVQAAGIGFASARGEA